MPKGVYPRRSRPAKDRFWDRVEKTDTCWNWNAYRDAKGYGRFTFMEGGKNVAVFAHRYAYELENGFRLPKDVLLMHTCDNPSCVRPDHLFPGSHQDNMDDKVSKSRQATGENVASAKLTEDDVREIRRIYDSGMLNLSGAARRYSVSVATIWKIVHHESWTHI